MVPLPPSLDTGTVWTLGRCRCRDGMGGHGACGDSMCKKHRMLHRLPRVEERVFQPSQDRAGLVLAVLLVPDWGGLGVKVFLLASISSGVAGGRRRAPRGGFGACEGYRDSMVLLRGVAGLCVGRA